MPQIGLGPFVEAEAGDNTYRHGTRSLRNLVFPDFTLPFVQTSLKPIISPHFGAVDGGIPFSITTYTFTDGKYTWDPTRSPTVL